MPHAAIVVFTAKPAEQILADGGSGDWRLDPQRARQAEYLVCTQNQHNSDPIDPRVGPPRAPHGAAFLIARISGVAPSPAEPKRWVINIREYTECLLLNIWRKSGQIHLRYPVWYTTLEDLGIDLATLPPFRPLPQPSGTNELSEAAMPLLDSAPRPHASAWPGAATRPPAGPGAARRHPRPARPHPRSASSRQSAGLGRAWRAAVIAVDTSAIVAIALNEPERAAFRAAILQADTALISTASVLETKLVLHGRRGPRAVALAEDLFSLKLFEIVPPGAEDLDAAFRAFIVFGKGSGHPAALNYGDLFSYALAKVRGLPLLFKGNDFAETDIPAAVAHLPV